jgi:hypothetical protein
VSDYLTNLIGQQRPKNTVPVPTQTQGPYVPPFPTKPKFKLLPDSPQDALRELGENFGVVGRGLTQGVAAPVTMIADPLTDFINQVLPKGYKQTRPGEAIGQGLDVAGVPRATTDAQKVLEAGTSGLAGGGAIAKTAQLAGKGAQALKGYLDTIGKDLAGQMTSGLGSGAGSVGASQAATASGASPVVAQLAGLGGGIVGGGARPVESRGILLKNGIDTTKPLTISHGADSSFNFDLGKVGTKRATTEGWGAYYASDKRNAKKFGKVLNNVLLQPEDIERFMDGGSRFSQQTPFVQDKLRKYISENLSNPDKDEISRKAVGFSKDLINAGWIREYPFLQSQKWNPDELKKSILAMEEGPKKNILRKTLLSNEDPTMEEVYKDYAAQNSDKSASKLFNSYGIPGMIFSSSRDIHSVIPGSPNFLIWDQDLLNKNAYPQAN